MPNDQCNGLCSFHEGEILTADVNCPQHGLKAMFGPAVQRASLSQGELSVIGKSDLSERFIVIECRDASARSRFSKLLVAATELLALAKQYASKCTGCDGTGFADRFTGIGTPEYMEHTVPCPDCADIRAVIAKAETPV